MRYKDLLNTNDILHLLTNKLNFIPKQMGKNIFFLCPFHNDKNPSLSFEPSRKIFTCFSCGIKASDIVDFWAKYRKIDVEKALVEISEFGYFSLASIQKEKKQEQKNENKIFVLNSLVSDIYQHNLFTEKGKEVLSYLYNKRQISKLMIEKFLLGCTIDGKQITNLFYNQQKNDKFSFLDLTNTKLVWITDDNRNFDFFKEKQLIIPLTNIEEKIVAFTAREVRDIANNEGKYRYLPSHQHYQKSSLLYNYSTVKKSRSEECYLVEGFFDVISLTEKGIENCMAMLGTNLSEEQLKLILELKKRIILFLDGDKAGQESVITTSVKLLNKEVDCEIIKHSYQGDPDEICHHNDKELLTSIIQKRENPYLFILDYYFSKLEIKENPQRVSSFISEIAKIFQKFKINIKNFLIEKISLMIKWNKEEVEPYFIQWNFPIRDIKYSRILYCQEIIKNKERKIICLCYQKKSFWLLTIKKNYFFIDTRERKSYQNIYNYYISSPNNEVFFGGKNNECYCKSSHEEEKNSLTQQKDFVNKLFQQINIVKKFLLNYEKKR